MNFTKKEKIRKEKLKKEFRQKSEIKNERNSKINLARKEKLKMRNSNF
jgi:hypothetical protein